MRRRARIALLLIAVVLGATAGTAVAAPVVISVRGTTTLNAVSCPAVGSCLAAGSGAFPSGPGSDGMTVTVGDRVGLPQPVPGVTTSSGTVLPVVTSLAGVSCPARVCLAAGSGQPGFASGAVVPIAGGASGQPRSFFGIPLVGGIACTRIDDCLVAGGATLGTPPTFALVPVTHGTPGAPFGPGSLGTFEGVSCAAEVCWAVGYGIDLPTGGTTGALVRSVGGVAGAVQSVAVNKFNGVSCAADDTCLAVGDAALVPITNGQVGGVEPIPGAASLAAVSCVSTSACLAVGQSSGGGGVAVPVIGGVPGTPTKIPAVDGLLGVACRVTRCVAVGVQGPAGNQQGAVVTGLTLG